MGDFNIDTLVSNKTFESFRNMNQTLDLKLLVEGSLTRINETTNIYIDHVLLSSSFKFIYAYVENCDISGHWVILLITGENNEVIQRSPLQNLNNFDISCGAFLKLIICWANTSSKKLNLIMATNCYSKILYQRLINLFLLNHLSKKIQWKCRPQCMSRKIRNVIKTKQEAHQIYLQRKSRN